MLFNGASSFSNLFWYNFRQVLFIEKITQFLADALKHLSLLVTCNFLHCSTPTRVVNPLTKLKKRESSVCARVCIVNWIPSHLSDYRKTLVVVCRSAILCSAAAAEQSKKQSRCSLARSLARAELCCARSLLLWCEPGLFAFFSRALGLNNAVRCTDQLKHTFSIMQNKAARSRWLLWTSAEVQRTKCFQTRRSLFNEASASALSIFVVSLSNVFLFSHSRLVCFLALAFSFEF